MREFGMFAKFRSVEIIGGPYLSQVTRRGDC